MNVSATLRIRGRLVSIGSHEWESHFLPCSMLTGLEIASPARRADETPWARFATMTARMTPSIPTLKTMSSG